MWEVSFAHKSGKPDVFPSLYARCVGADRTAQRPQALRRRPGPGFKAQDSSYISRDFLVTPCVDIALASNLALANSAYIPYAVPTTFVVVVSCVTALLLLVRVFTRGSRAISTTGATYLDLHLLCVYIAGVALVIAIVLGLTLGPDKARKISRRYDDEGAGDDERVFREGAYVRCGLLALILAVFGLGVRLRRVAGAPTTRRLASRSIELTSHAS